MIGLCAGWVAAGCSARTIPREDTLVVEVAPETVECTGEMVQRCLRVRVEPGGEWITFFDPIEGFTHEEGVRYRLEVVRRAVSAPPADGSAFQYRLVRVLSREPEPGPG